MTDRIDPFQNEMSLRDIASLQTQKPSAPAPKTASEPINSSPQPQKQKPNTTLMGEPADTVVINPPVPEMNESTENHAVFAFGRFNPPTIGHEKLIRKVEQIAKQVGGSAHVHIIGSHSQYTFKDPLPQKDKLEYLKKVASEGTSVSGSSKESPTFLQQAAKLHQQGVTHLHMVAGSDRVGEYTDKLNKYNGRHEGALFNFKKIQVHSAGARDPDAEGAEGMSGTKMRALAREGNYKEFKQGLPQALHPHAKEIANHVRAIKEENSEGSIEQELITERVVSLQQRMRRAVNMRKNKTRLARARTIARRRLAGRAQVSRRAMKRAKSILRQRLAGSQGAKYKSLSKAQKIAVDKMVERRKTAIKRIAVKIAPRIRSDELKRLSAVQHGKSYRNSKMPVVASFDITDKESNYLVEKARETGIDYQTLLQVFNRGKVAWTKDLPPGKTPSQYAFNRLNSFIQGGKAFKEDVDLRENMKTTVRDVLAKGMHTARMMGDVNPEHIPAIHPGYMQAGVKKGADETDTKRKRAALIRTKAKEYITKVVDEHISLKESVDIVLRVVKPSRLAAAVNKRKSRIDQAALKQRLLKKFGEKHPSGERIPPAPPQTLTSILKSRLRKESLDVVCVPEEDYIYEEMSWDDWVVRCENINEDFIEEGVGIDELNRSTMVVYMNSARAAVKELRPHAKGEYGDLAKNMIARRKRGIALAKRGIAKAKRGVMEESDKANVKLNKPFRTPGGPKKFAVYVKNDKGNVIKLGFGDPNLEIKRDDPDRRKAYRARHGCDNPGPKWKANYWSCNWSWSASKKVGA